MFRFVSVRRLGFQDKLAVDGPVIFARKGAKTQRISLASWRLCVIILSENYSVVYHLTQNATQTANNESKFNIFNFDLQTRIVTRYLNVPVE